MWSIREPQGRGKILIKSPEGIKLNEKIVNASAYKKRESSERHDMPNSGFSHY